MIGSKELFKLLYSDSIVAGKYGPDKELSFLGAIDEININRDETSVCLRSPFSDASRWFSPEDLYRVTAQHEDVVDGLQAVTSRGER